jgi:hypothetical protein
MKQTRRAAAGDRRRRAPKDDVVHLATDSEWDRSLPEPWLSTAFAGPSGVTVFFRSDLPEDIKVRLQAEADRLGVLLAFVERDDATTLLLQAGTALNLKARQVDLLLFFSPKDIEYAVGWDRFKAAIEQDRVRQKNSLVGRLTADGQRVRLKDLCGWAGKASLTDFAASMGVPAADKGAMDAYKDCMHQGLQERPEEFLRYAVGDVRVLLELHSAFLGHFQTLQRECIAFKGDDVWTRDDIPMTTGSLVARTLERWLYAQAADRRALNFCIRKLGLLDPDTKNHAKNLQVYQEVVRRFRTSAALHERDADLGHFFEADFLHTALDACSVGWWASRPATETTSFLALVHGGRCVNEMPGAYRMEHGLDVDISGCYGEVLRSLTYPIGLPRSWGWTPNDQRMTLGQWLDRNRDELLPGLWMAVVEGPLNFQQDLVFSRLVKASDIRRAAMRREAAEGDGETPGDFVLLRREIKNGVITHDVLQALEKVATKAEWSQLRALRLVTAAAYLKKDRVDSMEAWCDAVLADQGAYSTDPRTGTARDSRTRAWVGVPLDGFVGRLADRRKHLKAVARDANASEDDRRRASGMEQLLKLTINTTFGVLGSRFFPVGNTVVGNNITARARVGMWMLAKSLGLRQSITDGGPYTPNAVPAFDAERRPGLQNLSRMWEWHNPRRGRRLKPLAGADWETGLPPAGEPDRMALEHVQAFWRPYGLTFPFAIAHKAERSFLRAAYWSKGDYALQTRETTVYAVRGKDRGRTRVPQHPTFRLLDNILAGNDEFPQDLTYTYHAILRIKKWKLMQGSAGQAHLRPGDDYAEDRIARYNNNSFPLDTEADYLRRRNRRKLHRGKAVQWFEKFGQEGIAAVHGRMAADRLR